MKNQIKEYVHGLNNVTFAELVRIIPDSSGDRMIVHHEHSNLVYWDRLSQEFIDAVMELLSDGIITLRAIPADDAMLLHAPHGDALDYPVARRVQNYAKPHWLPVVFMRG